VAHTSVITTPRATDTQPPTLSVIAPCFNEEQNIDALVDRVLTVFDAMEAIAELILIDDGSSDDTWNKIKQRASKDHRVHGAKHAQNGGIETAWKTGIETSLGHLICLIDADLQNRPEDIPLLYKTYLHEVPDIVQAVRHATGPARQRQLFSRGLNLLLNLAFGMNLGDNKSGFILARRDALQNILRHKYRYRYFQSFIGVAAGARGYLIAETDTVFERRQAGRSFLPRFPIAASARILWELVKYWHETRCQLRRPLARKATAFEHSIGIAGPGSGETS